MLTEANLPFSEGESAGDFVDSIAEALGDRYPYLVENITHAVDPDGNYDFGDEFPIGLDLILDGLERRWAVLGAE